MLMIKLPALLSNLEKMDHTHHRISQKRWPLPTNITHIELALEEAW